MTLIAEFTVSTDDFPLGKLFESLPNVSIQLDRIVPTNNAIMPYFWAWNSDADEILAILKDQPEFEEVSLMDNLGDEALFRAQWNQDIDGILTGINQSDVTVLSATGTSKSWVFELRGQDREGISEFLQYCQAHGIEITLMRIQRLTEMVANDRFDLTEEQREALLLAFNEGYYNEPRETSLEELASELGITRQSFSARLKRGYRNLLSSTIVS